MNASLKILPSVDAGTKCQGTAAGSLSDHLGRVCPATCDDLSKTGETNASALLFPLFLDSSEDELQGELKNARGAGRENLPNRTTRDGAIGHPEINVVEYVEEFSAELHGGLFRHPSVFEEAEIRIEKLRSPQNIFSGVPKRSDGVRCELRGIEPLLNHRSV